MRFYDQSADRDYNHYLIGWAMAFNTPYKLFGATPRTMAASPTPQSSPAGTDRRAAGVDNYVNVSDITPTVYDLLA
jgi:arylsulfatase